MYLPRALFDTVNSPSLLAKWAPVVDASRFTLSIASVLGLVGGDEAALAIATVLVHEHRRFYGWYNTPGSYWIARNYGLAAMSTLFKELFPGAGAHPADVFEPDGRQRPKFRAVYSGTVQDNTGHLASLLMKKCASLKSRPDGVSVSIATLGDHTPPKELKLRLSSSRTLFAIIPIVCSVAACVLSGFLEDWYSFASILMGMVSNGVFCIVIGRGTLYFRHKIPAGGCPPGDGLLESGNDFVFLRGDEAAVNSITGGSLSLEFPAKYDRRLIGYCSTLFFIQFIGQLVLIPQASLVGQLVFVASLAVSWAWNWWLYAWEKENIQNRILMEVVFEDNIDLKEAPFLPRRTNAAVFVLCFLLLHGQAGRETNGAQAAVGSTTNNAENHNQNISPDAAAAVKILKAILPNDTKVWQQWRNTISDRLCTERKFYFSREDVDGHGEEYTDDEHNALQTLYRYAQEAYDEYKKYEIDTLSRDRENAPTS